MKKIFQVLFVLALVAAVIGYFRNWYTVTRVDQDQQTNINLQINRQRIKEDLDLAAEKAKHVTGQMPSDTGQQPAPEAASAARP